MHQFLSLRWNEGNTKKLCVPNVDYGLDAQNKIDLEDRRSVFGKNQWSRSQVNRQATVLRNGGKQQIPIVEIVVGDVCPLNAGQISFTSNHKIT
jgi:hypothetical protein